MYDMHYTQVKNRRWKCNGAVWMKKNKTLEYNAVNREKKSALRHTMTNSSIKEQQYTNTRHSSRQVYTKTYSYVVQQRTV